jgi:hypothetical protein
MPETTPSPDMHTMSLLIILFLLCLHHASHCAYTLLPNNAISPYINLTFASHESFPQQNIMSSIPQDILDSTVHSLVELAYVRCTPMSAQNVNRTLWRTSHPVHLVSFTEPVVSAVHIIPADQSTWADGEVAPTIPASDIANAETLATNSLLEAFILEGREAIQAGAQERLEIARERLCSLMCLQGEMYSQVEETGIILRVPVKVEEAMTTVFRAPVHSPLRSCLIRRNAAATANAPATSRFSQFLAPECFGTTEDGEGGE